MSAQWQIEPLDRKRHDRKSFDCGNCELNDWLAKLAGQYEQRDLARTYVATAPESERVIGYYLLCTHHVQFEALPKSEAKGLPARQHVPVVLLGKLAVCRSVQGQGLGAILLFDALRLAEHVFARRRSACRRSRCDQRRGKGVLSQARICFHDG